MNEKHDHERDEIRDLLVEAGPPAELPEADLAEIRKAARRRWAEMSSTPIFEGRSSRVLLAMAASLLVVLTAVWLYRSAGPPATATTVATVELIRADAEAEVGLAAGDALASGAELSTAGADGSPVQLALRMASGHSVRLDADSKIRLASAARLELEWGAVYVDSGAEGAAFGLEIGTPLGTTVREIGTQFEVRVNGTVRVRVREGSVTVSSSGRTFSAAPGEQLLVDARGGVDRSAVAIAGPDWAWVQETAPTLDVEGRTLEAYLRWISRETGWRVRYEGAELEATATEIVYGSIKGLTPEESLDAVLPSSGLDYRIENGTLVITRAS